MAILAAHPHLAWFPLPTQHPLQVVYDRLKLVRAGPFLDTEYQQSSTVHQISTEGTCDRPQNQNCCKAAWAAVRKVSTNSDDPSIHDFEILQVSHVKGQQTINRGELESVVWVTEFYAN